MLVPFLIYYHQRDLNSLADVVNEVLRTVPLGALLAALVPMAAARPGGRPWSASGPGRCWRSASSSSSAVTPRSPTPSGPRPGRRSASRSGVGAGPWSRVEGG